MLLSAGDQVDIVTFGVLQSGRLCKDVQCLGVESFLWFQIRHGELKRVMCSREVWISLASVDMEGTMMEQQIGHIADCCLAGLSYAVTCLHGTENPQF